jgi:hypothetical protein
MMDPSLPLQQGVYNVLRSGLKASIGVYDEVPAKNGQIAASFPYVQIGEDQVVSEADQCHDASAVFATVHVWSRQRGKVEAKTIMAQVIQLLDQPIAVTGFQVISAAVDDGPRHFTDADGLTKHSVVTIRYRMGPTA